MGRGSKWLVALLGVLLLNSTPALADQRKCDSSQLKELGRYSNKVYKCLSKAAKKNEGAGECIADASNALTKKLEKIEKKSGCKIENDFGALDLGLQSAIARSTREVQESLKFSNASIEPCEPNYADIYEIALLKDDALVARVDTIDNRFYFDPDLRLEGVTNSVCVAGSRIVEQLMEFDFECSFDPQELEDLRCLAGPNQGVPCGEVGVPALFCETAPGLADGECVDFHPDGFCPELTITSGPVEQVCRLTVLVEGSCEDQASSPSDETRGDYRLEIFINDLPAVAERIQSNVLVP